VKPVSRTTADVAAIITVADVAAVTPAFSVDPSEFMGSRAPDTSGYLTTANSVDILCKLVTISGAVIFAADRRLQVCGLELSSGLTRSTGSCRL
jgi:hypothetical protein